MSLLCSRSDGVSIGADCIGMTGSNLGSVIWGMGGVGSIDLFTPKNIHFYGEQLSSLKESNSS